MRVLLRLQTEDEHVMTTIKRMAFAAILSAGAGIALMGAANAQDTMKKGEMKSDSMKPGEMKSDMMKKPDDMKPHGMKSDAMMKDDMKKDMSKPDAMMKK